MSLKMNESPYQRSPRTTFKIMMELTAALLVVWLAAVIYNFTLSSTLGLRAILLMVVAVAFTAFIDAVVALIRHKKGADIVKEVVDGVVRNYSYVTAIIFTLCCPVYVSYYVILIGCLFSTGIKHCFGGFGKNVFNPAIIGRIVTGVFFADAFSTNAANNIQADLMASPTVTTQYNALSGTTSTWLSGSLPEGYNLSRILLGNYIGAMGETFTILILVLGIFLALRNVINWRSSAFYLGTVTITAFVIGLFVEGVNPFSYVIYHLALGGLMFGAIFMITDPVTSPTSPFGKSLIGVIAGLLTVLFRLDSNNPEGVMFSIAIVNILSPLIDRLITGRTTEGQGKKWGIIGGLVAASVVINTAISVSNLKAKETNTTSSSLVGDNTSSSSSTSNSAESILFGIEGATYKKAAFNTIPSNSNIKNVYIASVNDVETAICYELTTSFTWASENGNQTINPTLGISFKLSDHTVLNANIVNGGTNDSFDSPVNTVLEQLKGKEAAVLAQMSLESHDGIDFATGATKSKEVAFKLAVEAANQYVNVDKVTYNFNYSAAYEEFTLNTLPSETNIQKAYIGKVNGLSKVAGYELLKTFSWESENGKQQFNSNVFVTINLDNNTIAAVNVVNGGTGPSFINSSNEELKQLVGKDVADISQMTLTSHEGIDFTSGATKSKEVAFELVVEATKQYIVDQYSLRFGYSATYEETTLGTLPSDTSIVKTYVGKVENVSKVVSYELNTSFTWASEAGNQTINPLMFITFDLENDEIISLSLFKDGTADNFWIPAELFAAKLIGLDANDVAQMTLTSHDGIDFETGSTKSKETAFNLAIEACAQYVNTDKGLVNGGANNE